MHLFSLLGFGAKRAFFVPQPPPSRTEPAAPLGACLCTLAVLLAGGCDPDTSADLPGNGQVSNPSATPDTGVAQPAVDASSQLPQPDAGMASGPADTGTGTIGSASDAASGPAADGQVALPGPDASTNGDPRLSGLEGSGLSAFPTSGAPIDVPERTWTYVEFADSSCRNGSRAGVTLWRNRQSKKVMFFYEGGGACFDDLTCLANPDAVGELSKSPSGGILDRSRPDNPVKDWNVVYVPYCTGDVFGGTNPNGNIGGTQQKFVGNLNNKAFLQRLVPTFSDVTDVLVTGVSAGGFGAAMSASLIQRAFPWVKIKIVDDSGPPMPSSALPTCLQKKWRETWGLDQSVLADCGASCPNKDDYTMDLGVFLAKAFPNRLSGLIEAQEDFVISGFFGAGLDIGGGPCSGIPLVTAVPGEQFHAGLLTFRDALKSYPNFGTFYPPGGDHTWLQGDTFYTASVDGTTLLSWFSDIVNDKGTKHVGK